MKFTTFLLGIGLPFFGYVGLCIFIFESNMENFILETYSSKQLLIKSIIILISLLVIGIISFRLTNYLVYGRLIKKIDEMIDELNLLKK
jgi:tetrahydromethanopterin S-methyltransferase subunit C